MNPYNPCNKHHYELFQNPLYSQNCITMPLRELTNHYANSSKDLNLSEEKENNISIYADRMLKEINNLKTENDVIGYYLNDRLSIKLMKIQPQASRQKVYSELAYRCGKIIDSWKATMNKKISAQTDSKGWGTGTLKGLNSHRDTIAEIKQKNQNLVEAGLIEPHSFLFI